MPKKKTNKTKQIDNKMPVSTMPPTNVKVSTRADEIWNHIKNIQLDMFALPNQTTAKYCEPITIEHTKLYLKYKAAAVYPALEVALRKVYDVEMADKLIIISDKKKTPQV